MPGLHDLLPRYRGVRDGDDVRRLTPATWRRSAATPNWPARQPTSTTASARSRCPTTGPSWAPPSPPGRACPCATAWSSPTWTGRGRTATAPSSATAGAACATSTSRGRHRLPRVGRRGPGGDPLPLQHGAVAKAETALDAVAEILREDIHLGPPQGDPGCGLATPTWWRRAAPGPCRSPGPTRSPGSAAALSTSRTPPTDRHRPSAGRTARSPRRSPSARPACTG
ncbi:hypothetical protein NKH77_32615 [Streptomyces sp. M19]